MIDTFVAGSCMPVPVDASDTLGSRLAMSARAPCHIDASDTIIYVCQKAQTVPSKGKATPMGIPCVRPQSDMRCYMLDRCGIESGS